MKSKKLPRLTEEMHKAYIKWSSNNFDKTLSKHSKETEKMINKISAFDLWSDCLHDNNAAKKLIPEIFWDAYMSIIFSTLSLYKYAYMCLRSQLETTLRLVYFSSHPIEFNWWQEENKWYKGKLIINRVWGKGYDYFENLEFIKLFENKCRKDMQLFANGNKLRKLYQNLSQYVHSSARSLQTAATRLSPKYKISEFNKWKKSFSDLHEYINIIFILTFFSFFKKMTNAGKNEIVKKGIKGRQYKELIKEIVKSTPNRND